MNQKLIIEAYKSIEYKGGEKLEYLLVIPGRLDNLNDYISAERTNRYKGAKMKSKNEAIVNCAILQCMRGVRIEKPVHMKYRWYEKNKRRDKDNISSYGRKVIQDSLVYSHVLKNDGWKEITGFSDEFFVDADNPRIEVLIREVGDDG
jgi:Holliday junction resolvase RusA-like endonuclease